MVPKHNGITAKKWQWHPDWLSSTTLKIGGEDLPPDVRLSLNGEQKVSGAIIDHFCRAMATKAASSGLNVEVS